MPISFCSSGAPFYGVLKEERTFPPESHAVQTVLLLSCACVSHLDCLAGKTNTHTRVDTQTPATLPGVVSPLSSKSSSTNKTVVSPGRLLLWTLTDLTENNLVATNPSNRFDESRRRSRRRLHVLSDYNESVDATADAFVIAAGGAALEAALPGTVRIVSEG